MFYRGIIENKQTGLRIRSASSFSHIRLFATLWTVTHQAPLVHGYSPGKNTGVGCHTLLQGIFPTQGSNPGLPHCRRILFFFFIYFYQLEANYFTILQCFLSYIDLNQPWIYMYSPSRSPPPTSLSTQSLWVFPVHQAQALVSCIQPRLVIYFTLDNIHVLMLFS